MGDIDGDLMDPWDIPPKLQAPLTGLLLLPLVEAGKLRWSDMGEVRFGEGVLRLGGITYGVNLCDIPKAAAVGKPGLESLISVEPTIPEAT